MAWIEGLSSSNRLLQDLAKITTQANKDTSGNVDKAKNWDIVFPRPFNITQVSGEALAQDTTNPLMFKAAKADWFTAHAPWVYETISGTTMVVDETAYTVDYTAGTITFASAPSGSITADYTYVTDRSLETAFGKIGPHGHIILKTTTTPVAPNTASDPFNTDPDLKASELTMFVEIEKPQFLVNPETGQMAAKFGATTPIENHYHLNMRMFDRYDEDKEIPVEQVIDPVSGLITDEGAHVSEWSKLSWYSDFKEFLVDELDADPGTDNINDGIVFTYLETTGLYGEVPIQYWISTNNDRIGMVLMGEPSINYDNYLTSFAYLGRIDSFEGSKNDTAGNFALTVGSSTIPCVSKPNTDPITEQTTFGVSVLQSLVDTTTTTSASYISSVDYVLSYKVVAYNDQGHSLATNEVQALYTNKYSTLSGSTQAPTDYSNFRVTFTNIPANATKVKLFRKDVNIKAPTGGTNTNDTGWFFEAELTRAAALAAPYTPVEAQDKNQPVPVTNVDNSRVGVLRDPITGAVLEVKFPKTWGSNTATGVNDIAMYKTRSGVYFQRHQASFITPEEFMKKDAFNPSRWTNKFHLSPLYVVHGYDGYRGFLKDVVVVDDSSIVHLDELIVGKGTAQEEIYKYFRLSAPFSLMQNSANANYGIAIKKV